MNTNTPVLQQIAAGNLKTKESVKRIAAKFKFSEEYVRHRAGEIAHDSKVLDLQAALDLLEKGDLKL